LINFIKKVNEANAHNINRNIMRRVRSLSMIEGELISADLNGKQTALQMGIGTAGRQRVVSSQITSVWDTIPECKNVETGHFPNSPTRQFMQFGIRKHPSSMLVCPGVEDSATRIFG
jgi:hypothetical protein